MIRGGQTRDEYAGAIIADLVVVVTTEYISKNLFEKEPKGLDLRALPFKILPCAIAVSGDLVQMLDVQTIIAFGFRPFAVILCNMSK